MDPTQLTRNWRTPQQMVDIGNLLLEKRRKIRNESKPKEIGSSSKSSTKPEVVILNDNDEKTNTELEKLLRQDVVDRFIIALTPDDEGIKNLKENEKILKKQIIEDYKIESISDVKGLEKSTVILYKFAEYLEKEYSKLITEDKPAGHLNAEEKIGVLFSLNKLYIAITRTTNRLVILDNRRAVETFWQSDSKDWKKDLFVVENDALGWIETEIQTADTNFVLDDFAQNQLEMYDRSSDIKYLIWFMKKVWPYRNLVSEMSVRNPKFNALTFDVEQKFSRLNIPELDKKFTINDRKILEKNYAKIVANYWEELADEIKREEEAGQNNS